MSRSGVVKPGTSALVESTMNRSTPSVPEPGEGPQVGDPAVQRQLIHLEVTGVQDRTRGGTDCDGQGIGNGVVHRDELAGRTGRG